MQMIGTRRSIEKTSAVRQRAEAGDRVAVDAFEEAARDAAPAGGVDVTLPGRVPRLAIAIR
jgi:hypothetical protein